MELSNSRAKKRQKLIKLFRDNSVYSGLFLNKGRFKTDKEIQAALLG